MIVFRKIVLSTVLIIVSISISAILVSSYAVPVFADGIANQDVHDVYLNSDKRAILLKFSGNAGSIGYMRDNLNSLEKFMDDNEGTHHDSSWNKWHMPNCVFCGIPPKGKGNYDGKDVSYGTDGDCSPCHWQTSKNDALAYIVGNPQKKIVLAGFSFGGGTATFLAENLQHIRQVEGVLLSDPVGPGLVGASRAGLAQKCNISHPIDGSCLASNENYRTMHGNIKAIFVDVQTLGWPPMDFGTYDIRTWDPHVAGTFVTNLFSDCLPHACHTEAASAPLQGSFIGHMTEHYNAKPTIELVGPNHYEVFPGELLEIETLSKDPFGFGEHRGDMRLFPRLDSLNNGIEPYSLIENGSFESGTFGNWDEPNGQFVTLGVGDSNLKPWIITSGTVDHVYRHWIAPDGSKSLDMSGDGIGSISQTFDTIEGETNYRVNFDVSANPVCSARNMGLIVQAGVSPLEHFVVNNAGKVPTQMNWEHRSYLFTAKGPTVNLQFTGTDSSGCGVTLDNVVVTKASSLETGTWFQTNYIAKPATFVIKIPDEAPPGTTITKTVWVEDNGWPCDNCSSTDDSIDGGAIGKWNSVDFIITILDPDKPPVSKPKLPDEKPPVSKPKLPDEKPPVGKPKLPDEKPPIADPPPPDGKFKPSELSIPKWVKNTAGWWSDKAVEDSDFTSGISYMIEEDIISIPDLPAATKAAEENVPEWVRNMAGWWADDLTTDKEFADAIKYLVEQGIIQVKT